MLVESADDHHSFLLLPNSALIDLKHEAQEQYEDRLDLKDLQQSQPMGCNLECTRIVSIRIVLGMTKRI